MKKEAVTISCFGMFLIIAGSIDNIRNLAGTAQSGSHIIFFFVLASIMFLIPSAMVSAYFSSNYTQKGEEGIYGWIKGVFNSDIALFALSCQFLQTFTWYPAVLAFVSGMITKLLLPSWSNHLTIFEILIFWLVTYINIMGLGTSFKVMKIFIMLGMVLPMGIILIFGGIWLAKGNHHYAHFTLSNIIPPLTHFNSWTALTFIITGFTGIELACVHIRNVHDPKKTFPKALFSASLFMLVTMVFGAVSIWMLIPNTAIDAEYGVATAFKLYLSSYHLNWLYPVLLTFIILGTLGQLVNWVLSPIRAIGYTVKDGYLPKILYKNNKRGVPQNLLILQAIIISTVCLLFSYMPPNNFMIILTSTGTEIYLGAYFVLFLAMLKLVLTKKIKREGFVPKVPLILSISGLSGCVLSLWVGFYQPSSVKQLVVNYHLVYILAISFSYLPLLYCYWYKYKKNPKYSFHTNIIETED